MKLNFKKLNFKLYKNKI